MALGANELLSSSTRAPFPRLVPHEDGVHVKKFASSAGAELLPIGTPVVFNTSTTFWQVYDEGALNGTGVIRGFVYPNALQLDASDEVLGNVLMAGVVHRDDINTAEIRGFLLGSPSEANLDAALRTNDPSLRELNIDVQGLTQVR